MKKSTFVLSATLCIGLVQMGLSPQAYAQPAPLSYSQVRALAHKNLEGEKYEEAEKAALQMLALAGEPDETDAARMVLGQSFYLRKMYDPARAQWAQVLAKNPTGVAATVTHLLLGRSYSAQGEFAKAVPHYEAALPGIDELEKENLAENPKKKEGPETLGASTILSLTLANAYYHTGQYDLAQQQLSRVMKLGPDVPFLYRAALLRSSEIDFMEFHFKKSVEGFTQVLAKSEDGPLLKKYAQRQIDWANAMIQTDWEGKKNAPNIKLKINLTGSPVDQKMNDAIQTLIDAIVDGAIVAALED